jgi:caffeoyl-CoA O-methyltransferase
MNRLEYYIEEHSRAGEPDHIALLAELERATNLRVVQPKMVSGSVQGAFLTLVTRILRPRRVLEIGTFTGYSALSIAAGLEEGAEIHTVEIDDELEEIARSFFDRSPHGHKIHLHIGSALDVVPRLVGSKYSETFDLVYIDGDKREYPDYYRMIMGGGGTPPMVGTGSIILADNVLWYGKAAEAEAEAGTEAETGTESEAGAGARTEAEAGAETRTRTEAGAETRTRTEAEAGVGAEAGTGTGTGTRTRTEAGAGTEAGTGTGAGAGAEAEARAGTEAGTETKTVGGSERIKDRYTAGIVEFNRMVSADPRVESVILPLRDGINLIRMK